MATRREFLVTTLAASALPSALLAASREQPRDLKVISETRCRDGHGFAGACDGAAETFTHDPATVLFTLEAGLAAGTIGTIVGLTRPSTWFLIEQSAARYGCVRTYHAHHRYAPDALVHELHASSTVNAVLGPRLLRTPRHWAPTLAGSLDILAAGEGAPETLTLAVPAYRPGPSPQLVSWMLRRKPA
jgi:hypothetical protein